jgi:hypothetical protein
MPENCRQEIADERMNAGAMPPKEGFCLDEKKRRMVVQNFTSPGMIARPDVCRYT